ncbi:hypothetical protein CTAM01_03781 [Colletotrichum tamarilloi]|uniref:Uncharacterized protein n=1 Tax=Colletotrichum tamarilloi TaxID=1209934 RepID=A0ABQ9RIG4_9PEZI|nr:uncharacterized protein CTAM01_03781 [Colletotrichum tamarilloi]KAK1504474.1 hypothetical protein CTAM01_03781 [Colletotrichum tamarilloi]
MLVLLPFGEGGKKTGEGLQGGKQTFAGTSNSILMLFLKTERNIIVEVPSWEEPETERVTQN